MSELATSADREAARLRDRLAEIEVEQATLEAELPPSTRTTCAWS